jgi:hypothetical protein
MYEELLSKLELVLQTETQVLPKGHNALADLSATIPSSWTRVLSSDASIADSIEQIWAPISEYAGDFLRTLVARTVDIALVLSSETSLLHLLYVLESSKGSIFGWLAGLPATEQDIIDCEARLGIRLPESYNLFCQVHNGFSLDGLKTAGPERLSGLFFLSTLLEGEPRSDDFDRLLAFSGDGAGNEQCYDLTMPTGDGDYVTVDWDHETRETSQPRVFWEYFHKIVTMWNGL